MTPAAQDILHRARQVPGAGLLVPLHAVRAGQEAVEMGLAEWGPFHGSKPDRPAWRRIFAVGAVLT